MVRADPGSYGWLADDTHKVLEAVETLLSRFPPPPGYERVAVEKGSFGEWLRGLPVAPRGTPVRDYRGEIVQAGDDPYVAGVVAIDVGDRNLQAGPDVAVRLHAEWMWSRGKRGEIGYEVGGRFDAPFEKWIRGERLVVRGGELAWIVNAKPLEDVRHENLREYLDSVFNWLNSRALIAQAERVEPQHVRAGDFFVHDGKPGDAVIILDMARSTETGRTVVMLGRALAPAQNVHVVSPGAQIAWFDVSPPTPVLTPHTEEFTWDLLCRLKS